VGKLLSNFKYKELEGLCLALLYKTKQIWELFVQVEIGSKYFD